VVDEDERASDLALGAIPLLVEHPAHALGQLAEVALVHRAADVVQRVVVLHAPVEDVEQALVGPMRVMTDPEAGLEEGVVDHEHRPHVLDR